MLFSCQNVEEAKSNLDSYLPARNPRWKKKIESEDDYNKETSETCAELVDAYESSKKKLHDHQQSKEVMKIWRMKDWNFVSDAVIDYEIDL